MRIKSAIRYETQVNAYKAKMATNHESERGRVKQRPRLMARSTISRPNSVACPNMNGIDWLRNTFGGYEV
jgi:hypothetical protein